MKTQKVTILHDDYYASFLPQIHSHCRYGIGLCHEVISFTSIKDTTIKFAFDHTEDVGCIIGKSL